MSIWTPTLADLFTRLSEYIGGSFIAALCPTTPTPCPSPLPALVVLAACCCCFLVSSASPPTDVILRFPLLTAVLYIFVFSTFALPSSLVIIHPFSHPLTYSIPSPSSLANFRIVTPVTAWAKHSLTNLSFAMLFRFTISLTWSSFSTRQE